jgi:hypothetical protein
MKDITLIIGAMKCGTTSLFYYLSEHPEITGAKEKEPHFFSSDDQYSKGLDWYYSLWDNAERSKIFLEASTTYTMQPKYPSVVERLAAVEDCNFRFIYMMRNPVVRIESHMRQLLAAGHQKQPGVIEEHLAFSEYARQLDPYIKTFGRDRVHLLLLEDLESQPKEELRKICEFLSIDPFYQFQRINLVMNSQQTLNLYPWIRKIYEISFIKLAARNIPPTIRQSLYKPFSMPKSLNIELTDLDQNKILTRLAPDLKRLVDEYEIDVNKKWDVSTHY